MAYSNISFNAPNIMKTNRNITSVPYLFSALKSPVNETRYKVSVHT